MTGILIACLIGAAFATLGAIVEDNPYDDGPNWPGTKP